MSHEDYVNINKIGEGTYGVVYKAKLKSTGQIIAVKNIRLEQEDEGVPTTTIREITTLIELKHPNVVELIDVIMTDKTLSLVFEFLSMDLKKYLDRLAETDFLDHDIIKSFMFQLCQAVCYCHQRRIVHRDLKPQNLLVDVKTNTLKVADFGLARAIVIPVRAYTHEVVTLWYRSPEVLMGTPRYHMGVDTWSVGCIFAEIARKRPLFPGDSEIDQLFRIFRTLGTPTEENWPSVKVLPDYKENFPRWTANTLAERMYDLLDKDGFDLLENLLAYDPMRRMSMRDALNHKYFNGFDSSTVPAGNYRGELKLRTPFSGSGDHPLYSHGT
uniref:Protein kinase domain-containing protein n=2 Tax=Bursaphelenchus xylophilus TaxID=6326 RepID=A0A1I7S083_BURXY